MKFLKNQNYFTISVYIFITAVAIIIAYLLLSNLRGSGETFSNIIGIFSPFLLGISISYILNPLMVWIEKWLYKNNTLAKRKKIRRGISVGLTFTIFLALLYGFFALILPQVSASVANLLANLTNYYENIELFITELANKNLRNLDISQEQINAFMGGFITELDRISAMITDFIPQIFGMIISFTAKLTNIIIAVIVTIYLLYSKEHFLAQIKKVLYAFTNTAKTQYALNLANKANKIFKDFISGNILDAIIIGSLTFISMCILRLEYASLISLIVGVTNLIPFLGPFIGAIPSAIILLMVDPMQSMIFLILILVIQQLDGNIIKPKVLGQAVGLSPFWIIFSVTVGGSLFGALGMFLGVPTFAVCYGIFKEIVEGKLDKKSLSTNTRDYRDDLEDSFPVPNRIKDKFKKKKEAEDPEVCIDNSENKEQSSNDATSEDSSNEEADDIDCR